MSVLAGLAVALLASTGPASAWVVVSDTGTTGAYEIRDDQDIQGADCIYESATKDLDRISVRGPRNVHGLGPQLQWIGYRFVIQRDAPPTGSGGWQTIHKSPIAYAQADENENPKSWGRRSWTAPETTSGDYRVQVVLFWYTTSSHASSARTGKVVIRYEWYEQLWDADFDTDVGVCDDQFT